MIRVILIFYSSFRTEKKSHQFGKYQKSHCPRTGLHYLSFTMTFAFPAFPAYSFYLEKITGFLTGFESQSGKERTNSALLSHCQEYCYPTLLKKKHLLCTIMRVEYICISNLKHVFLNTYTHTHAMYVLRYLHQFSCL